MILCIKNSNYELCMMYKSDINGDTLTMMFVFADTPLFCNSESTTDLSMDNLEYK